MASPIATISFGNHGVVTRRQARDEFVCIREQRCAPNILLAGVWAAEGDVFTDAPAEVEAPSVDPWRYRGRPIFFSIGNFAFGSGNPLPEDRQKARAAIDWGADAVVRLAERIVVLHAGRIVEEGTRTELISQGGRYAELYASQNPSHMTAIAE